MDRLDNPIWHALATEQSHLAETAGDASRFPPAMTALAGIRDGGDVAALAPLLAPGDVCGVFLGGDDSLPPALVRKDEAVCLQMVHDGGAAPLAETCEILGPADAPAMLALAESTRPGPFGLRTGELGTFLGVRSEGRLIAMAGQRMRLPGLVEVSGVCTDPAHLGKGLAARLLRAQLALLLPGAGVFLHVRDDNARAIALYERLGFRGRRRFRYVIVSRAV